MKGMDCRNRPAMDTISMPSHEKVEAAPICACEWHEETAKDERVCAPGELVASNRPDGFVDDVPAERLSGNGLVGY
jgi:hypothetical protein